MENLFLLPETETKWYLPRSVEKVEFYERKEVPQEVMDLLNGKKVKVTLNTKDWKMCYGSAS